ncbi:MAG TPA: DEAD/DEAH box helicase [Candidatus Nitrosotalea sp.]|nr:DEAD/DEAH box helicase [Candidatus Nitrosotalea sp.]
MSSIRIENNKLILQADTEVLRTIENKNFFCNELGATFENNSYLFNDTSIQNIEAIESFCKYLGVQVKLDSKASQIKQIEEGERQNFKNIILEATEIKNQTPGSIQVPYMNVEKQLMQYQIIPVKHASKLGFAANFSVPGSGKTWMAYATYFIQKSRGEVDRLLIIGPNSSFKPWETEYYEMTGKYPSPSIRISGSIKERRTLFNSLGEWEIFLVNYHMVWREEEAIAELLQKHKFMIVVDESHHIKNPNGRATRAVLNLSRYAKKRMVLSGTPVPNNFEDIWSQITFLYPNMEILGTYPDFQYNLQRHNPHEYVRESISPLYTRISKSMLDLPEPEVFRMDVPMSDIQKRIYDAIRGHIRESDKIQREDELAVLEWRKFAMIYLLESSTDPSLLTKSSQYREKTIMHEGLPIQNLIDEYSKYEIPNKLKAVQKLAESIMAKEDPVTRNPSKVIIWCSFVASIDKVANMLEKYNPICIHGAIPKDEEEDPEDNREDRIETFKNDPQCNVLIANPASLAESVSLHKWCHDAIYLDRTFNGGHYMQSLERIHRIGMDPHVTTRYHILLSGDSIDQRINDRLEIKKQRMLDILNESDIDEINYDLDFNEFNRENEINDDFASIQDHLNKP